MKTPEQITEAAAEAMVLKHELIREMGESARNSLAWELVTGDTLVVEDALEELVRRAIELDREQRDLYELIAEALDERAHIWDEEMPADTATRIREGLEDDYIWDDYIGPMLDRLTEGLGV